MVVIRPQRRRAVQRADPQHQRESHKASAPKSRRGIWSPPPALLLCAAAHETVREFAGERDGFDAAPRWRRACTRRGWRRCRAVRTRTRSMTCRPPSFNRGQASPCASRKMPCSALKVCTERPRRGEPKAGMKKPTINEYRRRAGGEQRRAAAYVDPDVTRRSSSWRHLFCSARDAPALHENVERDAPVPGGI